MKKRAESKSRKVKIFDNLLCCSKTLIQCDYLSFGDGLASNMIVD